VTLYCATTNRGKLAEFRMAAPAWLDLQAVPDLTAVPAPDETSDTFEGNARLKAAYYSRFVPFGSLVFADDSGLVVDALNGAPGVHSSRYSGPNATTSQNNALLLERLAGITGRSARFVCVVALARSGSILGTFEGRVEGRILNTPRGTGGFGYDPLFYSDALGCTLAEASEEDKLSVSHRGEALRALFAYLETTASDR
jgi:XTP/dITP diphosphohydrolase